MSQAFADALSDQRALTEMAQTPGWAVFCGQHEKVFTALTDAILNPKTPKDDADYLRQARAKIAEEFAPRKLLTTRLLQLDAIIKKNAPKPQNHPTDESPS